MNTKTNSDAIKFLELIIMNFEEQKNRLDTQTKMVGGFDYIEEEMKKELNTLKDQ